MNTQMQYHNPENVPADKVPKGWRFLTVEEARAYRAYDMVPTGRVWFYDFFPEHASGGQSYFAEFTYIIPDTQPEPVPSPWIAFSERHPTDADGTYVWVFGPDQLIPGAWYLPTNSVMYPNTHWMPASAIPPLPVERKPTQEEKDEATAAKLYPDESMIGNYDATQPLRAAFLAGLRHARAQGKEQP